MFEYKGVRFSWLGHDCFKITNGKTVYVDPYQITASDKADLVLVSHEHYDHFVPDDIKKVATPNTTLVAPTACEYEASRLKVKETVLVRPGDKHTFGDVTIEAVPAYNLNKFRAPGRPFHPKQAGHVGYIITIKGVRIYHAGDTDPIPEMNSFQPDVALLPVSGTYVMTAEEAAEAVKTLNPKVAIPMHYGAIVGSERDAEKFKNLASCNVQILRKE